MTIFFKWVNLIFQDRWSWKNAAHQIMDKVRWAACATIQTLILHKYPVLWYFQSSSAVEAYHTSLPPWITQLVSQNDSMYWLVLSLLFLVACILQLERSFQKWFSEIKSFFFFIIKCMVRQHGHCNCSAPNFNPVATMGHTCGFTEYTPVASMSTCARPHSCSDESLTRIAQMKT